LSRPIIASPRRRVASGAVNHGSRLTAINFHNKIGTERSTFAAQRVRPLSVVLPTFPKLVQDDQLAVAELAKAGHLNEQDRPYNPKSVLALINSPRPG
jgi:hypothetical protein